MRLAPENHPPLPGSHQCSVIELYFMAVDWSSSTESFLRVSFFRTCGIGVCILIPPSSPLSTLFGEFQQKKNRHSTSICKINSSRLQTPFFNLHLHHHPSRPSLWVHTYLQLPRPWLIKYFPSSCVPAACFILKISAQPSNRIPVLLNLQLETHIGCEPSFDLPWRVV